LRHQGEPGIASSVSTLLWCHLGRVGYEAARALQNRLAAERSAAARGDLLLLLEHPPVLTIGRNAVLGATPPALPLIRTDRGGNVTYHGPGQLVAYPVVKLGARVRGVRDFVARLEGALCDVARAHGVAAHVRCGAPGVWTGTDGDARKLASIGLAVRRGVTLHGAALNVTHEAEQGFAGFDPCGMPGVRMTSLAGAGAGEALSPADVAPDLAHALARRLGLDPERCDAGALAFDSPSTTAVTPARISDHHGHQPPP
jgi:lipoyl(octanoyl) transferase